MFLYFYIFIFARVYSYFPLLLNIFILITYILATTMAPISRTARILRYVQYAPRHLFNKYPEQFVCYATFGLTGLLACLYKINKYGIDGSKHIVISMFSYN